MAEVKELEATLEHLILNGPVEELREFLTTTEARAQRSKLSSLARTWHKKADGGAFEQDGDTYRFKADYPSHVSGNAFEAVVLTASAGEFKSIKWHAGEFSCLTETTARLLAPDCLNACVESLLIDNPRAYRGVRTLVSLGLCARPKIEQYGIGLIAYKGYHEKRDAFIAELRRDPSILKEDIWLLFEVEGSGEISLAAMDKFSRPGHLWSDVLYCLQEDDSLSRDRLLKASLEALNRGFIQFRAGWFSRFHEVLKPTESERSLLVEDYGRLLANNIPPTVSFALSAWLTIDKAKPIESEMVERYLPPCFASQTKSTLLAALSLVERVCKRDKAFRKPCLKMALQALAQENAEVQGRLLKLLKAHQDVVDEEITGLIEQQMAAITPPLVDEFRSILGNTAEPEMEICEVYSMADGACESFHMGTPLPVIESPEEFIEAALTIIETPFNPASVDVILKAVALGKVEALRNIGRSEDGSLLARMAAPLIARLKKVEKQQAESWNKGAFYFFLHFLLHFLGADTIADDHREKPLEYFRTLDDGAIEKISFCWTIRHFAERLLGILERTASGVFISAGLPSLDSGYVSAEEFLQQAKEASSVEFAFMEREPYLALMRLPWCAHDQVLKELGGKGYSGKYVEKLKTILRQLVLVRQKHAGADPCERSLLIVKDLRESSDKGMMEIAHSPAFKSRDESMLQLAFYNYPILCEEFHERGISECQSVVRWFEVADLALRFYFLPMALGFAPLQDRANLLLATGCLLSAPEVKSLVTDCLVRSIEERTLNTEHLGEKLGLLLHMEISMPKRVATILSEVARVSSLHNDAVRQILEYSLARNPEDSQIGTPRDLGAVLELLQSCALKARQPIGNAAARHYLGSLKPGSKTGKIAKELLALK